MISSRGAKSSSVKPSMDHLDSQLAGLFGPSLARQLAAQRASGGKWRVNHDVNMTLYAAAAEAIWMHPCRLVRRAGCATGQLPHKGARAVQSTARARGPLASSSLYTGSRLARERRRRRMAIA